ncbi:MAG: hypothetical protein KKD65_13840 [Gammaproteobacteria bacterium]|nr:hypothetical protein [Gammaproteobacteria bacterium]
MAISLITALKLVPWADVVSNAPLVVEGAKKLWKVVGKKKTPATAGNAEVEHELTPDERSIAAMGLRVSSLEADVADLQREMVSSAELIKALADQNAQLIKAVGLQRRLLLGVIAILGAVAVSCVYLLWVR